MKQKRRNGRGRAMAYQTLAGAMVALTAGTTVSAAEIASGIDGVQLRWDNTLKYSAAHRLHQPSVAVAGGDRVQPDFLSAGNQLDDGDRNFDRGLVSNRVDLFSELDLTYQNVGLRLSGAAWYDQLYQRGNANHSASVNTLSVPAGQFSAATRTLMGRKAELLDTFVFYKSSDEAQLPLSMRIGRHTVVYGESLFFGANGVAYAQSPVDLIKLLSVPGSQFKEVIRPVGQVSTQMQLSPTVSLGAYYQYDWQANRLPASGSYLSDVDFVGAGAESLLGMRKVVDAKPKSFQGGLQLRLKPGNGDVEYGLYTAQYSDKNPAIMMDIPAVFGAQASNTFHMVYPEKVRLLGASFSTVLGEANVSGEASYRWNAPLVSAPQPDLHLQGNGSDHPLYAVGKTAHAQLSAIYLMSKNSLWDGAELLGELAWNRTLSVSQNPLAIDPNVTRDATALRMIFSPQYFQVLSGLDLSLPIGLGYNPSGRSSAVFKFNGGVEHGGDVSIGLAGTYQRRVKFSLSFNHFVGKANAFLTANTTRIPGPYMQTGAQSLRDRDFVALSAQTTF